MKIKAVTATRLGRDTFGSLQTPCRFPPAFRRRCHKAGVTGVTLHCYRYAWAERAKVVGMPERFAQAALGHNSKAIHRAYAKQAQIIVPSLEEYETKAAELQTAKAS